MRRDSSTQQPFFSMGIFSRTILVIIMHHPLSFVIVNLPIDSLFSSYAKLQYDVTM